jgi:hypothetical protein
MRKPILILALAAAMAACGGEGAAPGETAAPGTDAARAVGSAGSAEAAKASNAEGAKAAETAEKKDDKKGPLERLFSREPEFREVTLPAGTVLPIELQSTVASDSSNVEDPVSARLRRAVVVGGVEALPAGSTLNGIVTAAKRSARVKGRAQVAFRFTSIVPAGRDERIDIRTSAVSRLAPGTKKKDAATIGIPAAGGAVIGGIVGGGSGAAKGAVIGGGAGTGVVLATRGKEVRFGPGADFSVRLLAPVTVRVPVKKQ